MNFLYSDQAPDLYLNFQGTTLAVHKEVVGSIPYFQELIGHDHEFKEVIDIPIPFHGAILYLNQIYSQHITLSDRLAMLKAGHYFGDDKIDSVFPRIKVYDFTYSQRVLILNVLATLTQHQTYQEMFYHVARGYDIYGNTKAHPTKSIYCEDFFLKEGVHLTCNAFSDIIRCNPSNPYVLFGLLHWATCRNKSPTSDEKRNNDFKFLIRKMDCDELFENYHAVMNKIQELIPTCPEPEFFHWNIHTVYEHMVIPIGNFYVINLAYDSSIKALVYRGNPNWSIQVKSCIPYVSPSGIHMSCAYDYANIYRIAQACCIQRYNMGIGEIDIQALSRDIFVDESMNKITDWQLPEEELRGIAHIKFNVTYDWLKHIPVCIPVAELFIVQERRVV